MADLVYRSFLKTLQKNILAGKYPDLKIPTERALSEEFQISRSSVKRAISILANEGVVFQKQGSGTFINPLYLKNDSIVHYHESQNLGITDSFALDGKQPGSKLISFEVIRPSSELIRDLFLDENEFVYEIKRLRTFDQQAFLIEVGYIPIKLMPNLSPENASGSIFSYLEESQNQRVSKSYLTISADKSNAEDQKLLNLDPTEPVSVMDGVFFLADGTPFEYSKMRIHYKYFKYNTFVATN